MKKLSKDDFLNLRRNPEIIPGIHNYCDRWCEKCPKTSHCSVFITEEAFNEINSKEPDASENPFALMENMFEITQSLIEDMAEKHVFDLSGITEDVSVQAENEFEQARNHPLSRKGNDYFKAVDVLLKGNGNYFAETAERQLMIFGEREESKLLTLKESFETIRWYCTLLAAKLHRAMGTYLDDDIDEEFTRDELFGTLKVSFIATQRSMVAWAKVLEYFPDKEDTILPLLVTLEQIYKTIIITFPQTITYKRPGLDD
ncbi:hypothetical protein HYN59_03180 [Flavobacterium album]|uniref:Uncharacterized protein n=1 Tax=Flavobacterium album TaxID=2175091 RepID=A0A2S1QUX4_9FLAO|nr:hypothetical protein [Flavobacterium album]AWH84176.1 hypothetical protein HYN59_03180 [Flavobacterium album]